MSQQQQRKQPRGGTSTNRTSLPPISINIEKVELKRGVPLEDRYLNAQFKHYCSESYAKTVSSSSCTISSSSFFREGIAIPEMVKNPLCRTRSRSAPASPKGGIHKSSTLQSNAFVDIKDSHLNSPTKKKKSASISNFFRKISPRLRRNTKDSKTWIVVEFSQCDIDGPIDKDSEDSDLSFEIALKNRDFKSEMKKMSSHDELTRKSDGSSLQTGKSERSHKHSLSKLSSRLQSGFKLNKKSRNAQQIKGAVTPKHDEVVESTQSFDDVAANSPNVQVGVNVVSEGDSKSPSKTTQQPPRSLYLRDRLPNRTTKALSQNMASLDSIGDCSLDVDASYNDSLHLKHSNTIDTSENTLRSMSLDDLDEARLENGKDQLKERSSSGQALKISNEAIDNYILDETFDNSKKPSYLNISCSISGYSDYSHYHRSRPETGAKYLSRSRDSSPMPGSKMLSTLNYNLSSFKETKMRITDEPDFINGKRDLETKEVIEYSDRRTETSDRKYFTSKHEFSVVSELKNAAVTMQNGNHSKDSIFKSQDGDSDFVSESKSLVKQRIEKLTAQKTDRGNFRRFDETTISHASISKGSPPVFRHLRKEFRDQLDVASKASKKDSAKSCESDHQSPASAHSSVNGHAHKNSEAEKPNPPVKPEGLVPMSSKLILEMSSKSEPKVAEESKRDGHYFLRVMEDTKKKIDKLLVQPLQEVEDDAISEEAKGKIRSAIGKANLLTTKKFSQFKGLCDKNINQNSDEQFSTKSSDLEGFWDMVMLQVTDICDTFAEIDKMRNNSWKEDAASKSNGVGRTKRGPLLRGQSKSAPTTPEKSAKSAAAAKAREEARKRLIAAKKKARQTNVQNSKDVEIYAP